MVTPIALRIEKKSRHITTPTIAITIWAILLASTHLVGCASIALYDQYAYAQTTSLKVDATRTMDLAVESFQIHRDHVEQLRVDLEKMYEYEKGRKDNDLSTQMWGILLDPNKHLLGGFLNRWEVEDVLGETFIQEAKALVGEAFDEISGLESQKIKSSQVKNEEVFGGSLLIK